MAVVLRGGEGRLDCCGGLMNLYHEQPDLAAEKNPLPINTPTMEHNLNIPVKNVMEIMQRRFVQETTYFGIRAIKNPLDFWVYQEIIYEVKPDYILEIGNCDGGSTLSMAHFLDNMGHGSLIGLDIDHDKISSAVRAHPRIKLFTGDAFAQADKVFDIIGPEDKALVIEDSSHTYQNTLDVLRTYGPLVKKGSYFIVEDSNCFHGIDEDHYPGPYEAIEEFMKETDRFEVDRSREAFFITWNPTGFLKCVN